MALSATIHKLTLAISDVDRGVYVTEELRLARHPSESMRYFVTRTLAYALAHEEGLAMGRGVSATDEPALWSHDLTGQLRTWIEVGSPSRDRVHRAAKAADKVMIFPTGDERALLRELSGDIHKKDEIEVHVLDGKLVDELAEFLDRTDAWDVTRTGGELFVTTHGKTVSGAVRTLSLTDGAT